MVYRSVAPQFRCRSINFGVDKAIQKSATALSMLASWVVLRRCRGAKYGIGFECLLAKFWTFNCLPSNECHGHP
jgi:hypothetical protein